MTNGYSYSTGTLSVMVIDTLNGETWKPIPEWEDYLVSDQGRVRTPSGNITHGHPNDRGYMRVQMQGPGGRKDMKVHRAVMLAFVGPCPAGMEVCHDDRDKSNNALSNLRYDTRSANIHDQVKHGVHYEATKTHFVCGHPKDEVYTGWRRNSRGRFIRACRECRGGRDRAEAVA